MHLTRLREVRLDRGLSQRQQGERLGTTQGRISMIETGANVTKETAERLARSLLCEVEDLVRPEEPTVTLKLSEIPPELLKALTQ
jgi:transcriptional regulator with XRE-family HTH domain